MIDTTTCSNNTFSKFNKPDYATNRGFLTATYKNQSQVKYYTPLKQDEVQIKKEKKNKKLIVGSAMFAVSMAIIAAVSSNTTLRNKLINDVEKSATELADNKFVKKALNTMQAMGANFTTLKDDLWRKVEKITKKIPGLNLINKGSNALTNKYFKVLGDTTSSQIEQIDNKLSKLNYNPAKFEFNYLKDNVVSDFNDSSACDLVIDAAKEGKIKGLWNKLLSPLRDNVISSSKKHSDYYQALMSKVPDNATDEVKNLIMERNKIIANTIAKAADIANGSAPTDIITGALPVATTAIALARTKNKEERNSVLLNLGVPLLPSVFMPVIGLKCPSLNGIKGLAVCLAVGWGVKEAVKFVDKRVFKKNKIDKKA